MATAFGQDHAQAKNLGRAVDASGTPLVEMRDISISFGGVHAVDRATIDLHEGEVMAILGHNGAGKSTLIKILSGAYKRDSGTIYIRGEEATITNPRDAKKYGIETIYQNSGAGRQCRRRRQSVSRPRAPNKLGNP